MMERIEPVPYQTDTAYTYAFLIARLIGLMHIRADVQWSVGDALQGLETIYESRTIQNVSDDIGASASSLYSWREMAAFYVPTIRRHYRELGLYFSHFREAFKLGSIDAAYAFLDECVALKYTTTQAAIEVRQRKGYSIQPPPVFHGPVTFALDRGRMTIAGLEGIQLEANVRYEITVRRAR